LHKHLRHFLFSGQGSTLPRQDFIPKAWKDDVTNGWWISARHEAGVVAKRLPETFTTGGYRRFKNRNPFERALTLSIVDRVPIKGLRVLCAICHEPMHSRRHILSCFQATELLTPFDPGGMSNDIISRIINQASEADTSGLLLAGQICNAALLNEPNKF